MNKIIAIVGMCGSGKSVASDYYEKMGLKKVYFGSFTLNKLKEEGLEINEKNERYIREKLRKEYGMGAYALLLLDYIEQCSNESDVILDGLYSWDELKILKDKFNDRLVILAIISDKSFRYNRLSKRPFRNLVEKDAMNRDISEIENLKKAGPIAYADYYILNNDSLDDFYKELEKVKKKILK